MTSGAIARELIAVIVAIFGAASAEEKATIRAEVDAAKAKIDATPQLGPAIRAAAEERRRELAASAPPVITHGVPDYREVPRFPASRIEARSLGQIAYEAHGGPESWGGIGHDERERWEKTAAKVREA